MDNRAWLNAREVAERLRVDPSRVRQLAARGKLPARKLGHDWVFDAALVMDVAARKRVRGRPFSPERALALLYEASKKHVDWLPEQRRPPRRPAKPASIVALLPRLRARSDRRSYRAPPAAIRRLEGDPGFVRSGVSASEHYGLRLSSRDVIEGYIDKNEFADFAYRYALELVPEGAANLIAHLVDGRLLPHEAFMPIAVVGADLADSVDPRSRDVGLESLRRLR